MLRMSPINDVYVRVDCDEAITRELSDYFQFDVPGAAFIQRKMQRSGRGGRWNGKIRLFHLKDRSIYRGLLPRLQEFADARGYKTEWDGYGMTAFGAKQMADRHAAGGPGIAMQWHHDFFAKLNLPVTVRDYQLSAFVHAVSMGRGIILSPTGSGKSLIIYTLSQYFKQKKTLIVVPTLGLVSQMTQDFRDYGCTEPIHIIKAGAEKRTLARITVSTWQSIYEQPASYFEQFETIIVDEVHTAKAKSLTWLMEKCTTTPNRFGFTATIDQTECHRLVLEGLFGSIVKVASTSDLIKAKQLAPLKVRMCVLSYPQAVRKEQNPKPYVEEMDFLTTHPVRNEFIARLVGETKGNTLVLFQYVQKQGLQLFARIVELAKANGKRVHYVAGSVSAEDRERIRQTVANSDNNIVVASYGTFQLGINIPNLDTLVFAHPVKSSIRVLQSIGRVLRPKDGKVAHLIDIVDDLRKKRRNGADMPNHAFRHAEERSRYYSTEKHPITMQQINVEALSRLMALPAGTPTAGDAQGVF
jgi:superfamily II DNA or RNA helicase